MPTESMMWKKVGYVVLHPEVAFISFDYGKGLIIQVLLFCSKQTKMSVE